MTTMLIKARGPQNNSVVGDTADHHRNSSNSTANRHQDQNEGKMIWTRERL
jgi:hypothetical protein